MTVHDLLIRLSKQELVDWMAFYHLEPWGCRMDDQRSGVIAATVANAMSSGARRFSSTDFFPPKTERERQLIIQQKVKAALGRYIHDG